MNEIWNLDKHRVIPVVATAVTFEELGIVSDDPLHAFTTEVIERAPSGPAIDGAHLALVRITPQFVPAPTDRGIQTPLQVRLSYMPGFADGPPGFGRPVFDVIEEIAGWVDQVVGRFEALG